MECRDAQFYLRLRRHAADELGPDVSAALDGHCATCAACAADARAAAAFDRALATAMRAVPVPSGLRERLITQAARAQGAALRNKALRVGGVAAAVLLTFGIGLSLYSTTRPKVNTDAIVQQSDDLYGKPAEYARKWLEAEKLPGELPWDFDYDLLIYCGYERIGDSNRYAPVMVFRSREGSGSAKVYMFREGGEFDTKEMRDAQASHFSTKIVVGKQQWRNVRYLAVHHGPPDHGLQRFFRQRGPEA